MDLHVSEGVYGNVRTELLLGNFSSGLYRSLIRNTAVAREPYPLAMRKVDCDALQRTLKLCLEQNPGRARQLDSMSMLAIHARRDKFYSGVAAAVLLRRMLGFCYGGC